MNVPPELEQSVRRQVEAAREASERLRRATTAEKDRALDAMADALIGREGDILAANAEDVAAAEASGTRGALLDRLRLDPERVAAMAEGLRALTRLPDPVGRLEDERVRPNGLKVARMRVPLGVIAMVYEARPGVTADAAGLCLKSGNAAVLRGGTEAARSSRAVARVLGDALEASGLPRAAVTLLEETDRAAILAVIRLAELVDLAIPRGGEGLVRFVTENARVPVLQHYKGVCHVYVDAAADLEKARRIAVNAKVQRPGVCNAMECLLVHRDVAARFLPEYAREVLARGVELRCDPAALEVLSAAEGRVVPAAEDDFGREFLDLVLAVKVVDGYDAAVAHVGRYGSRHTEAIVTEDPELGRRWQRDVDASCVVVNASTRFNDGGELGLGAEMGISTTKVHAYGPMGLEELTTRKFVVLGDGQVRE